MNQRNYDRTLADEPPNLESAQAEWEQAWADPEDGGPPWREHGADIRRSVRKLDEQARFTAQLIGTNQLSPLTLYRLTQALALAAASHAYDEGAISNLHYDLAASFWARMENDK